MPAPAVASHPSAWRRGFDLYLEHPVANAGRWFHYLARRIWPGRALRFTDADGNRYMSMKNNFTALAVAVLGDRDPNVARFLRRWVRPGFVAFDIGANIGTYTVPLSRLVGPTGRVVAFEPNRPTFACLRHNVRQNRLANVVALRAAAGPHPGRAALVVTDANYGEVHLAPGVPAADQPGVTVTTVDTEVARLGLERVDFIKLDVEGFELAALRGARDTLARTSDLVVQTEIVAAHAARYGFGLEELVAFFAELGYRPFVCDAQGHMQASTEVGAAPQASDWFWARSEAVLKSART